MSRRKGFTLIELLVVIAIIAVLAAILFPVFTSAKAKAHSSRCLNNMKQVNTALATYVDDWQSRFPDSEGMYYGRMWAALQQTGNNLVAARGPYIQDCLYKYIKTPDIWLCPIYKPSQRIPSQPNPSASYDMGIYYWKDNCGTSPPCRAAASNYMWMHLRYNRQRQHVRVSGAKAAGIQIPSKAIMFLEFPYWSPSPHKVIDSANSFRAAVNIAYFDGHVKL